MEHAEVLNADKNVNNVKVLHALEECNHDEDVHVKEEAESNHRVEHGKVLEEDQIEHELDQMRPGDSQMQRHRKKSEPGTLKWEEIIPFIGFLKFKYKIELVNVIKVPQILNV